ncbi:MAG: lysophospholipase [Firmicutes bacterium]|jgi:alpha-beta hydrolase superfamily lysophospholipase|nr:lysophospholipase [Bacillota bacterium]
MAGVAYSEETITTPDGTVLFLRAWKGAVEDKEAAKRGRPPAGPAPDVDGKPRAAVVIAHGLADHSGRFRHVAEYFAGLGYTVYAYDHRGQGKSGGVRGHVERFEQFYEDFGFVAGEIRRRRPGIRLFAIGHSMGGLIVLGHAARRPDVVDGIIASAPCLDLRMKVSGAKKTLVLALARVFPRLSVDTGIPAEHLCHDQNVVSSYKTDPVRYPRITTRFCVEFESAMKDVRGRAGSFAVPCLFMAGGADPIVATEVTVEFYERDPHPDKKLVVWDGLFHEIFNEPQKDEVLKTAADWIAEREGMPA